MPIDPIHDTLDTWYVHATVASRYLTGLYRSLNDGKQAFQAAQAGARASECARRLQRLDSVREQLEHFAHEHPVEIEAEEAAWQLLVESLAGVCAFFGIADGVGESPVKGLAGPRTATFKDFHRALMGYRTAFPEAMIEKGVNEAIARAASSCAQLTLHGIDPSSCMPDQQTVYDDILDSIHEALHKEARRVLTR